MSKQYDTPTINLDTEKNLDNGNLIHKWTVAEYQAFLHHTHSDSLATSDVSNIFSMISAKLSEDYGVDTTDIDAAIASMGSDSNGDTESDDPDAELNDGLPESTSTFSYTMSTEAASAAVAALNASIESETEESEFDTVVDEDSVLSEYLGCYEVSAETGVLTLASPVEVTDPEVYDAIVLHYNEETGEWEQVDGVEIIDGYVYAVFESLSPVAVYLLKKKYPVSVTVGETTTNYESISDAATAAMENVSNVVNITLNWNVVTNETIGPLYNDGTADNVITLDLNGYSLIGESVDGYVVSVIGTGSTQKLMIINGTIVADEDTTGALYVEQNYVALENVTLEGSKSGFAVMRQVDTKVYPTGCIIHSTNGICIQMEGDGVAGTCLLYSTDIIQVQEDNTENNAAVVLASSSKIQTVNVNTGTTVTSDVCGFRNMGAINKIYIGGDCEITAPIAAYISNDCTTATGFYTTTSGEVVVNGTIDANGTDASNGVALKIGTYSVKPASNYIANGYEASANEDGTYAVVAGEYVEITKSDGTVIVTNILSATSLYAGCTVKLLHDITASGLTINYASTIDLNGYTYTVTSSSGIYTNKDIEVTIKNGKLVCISTNEGGMAIGALRGTVHVIDMEIENEYGHGIVVGNNSKDYTATCDIYGNTKITAGVSGVFIQNKSGNTVVPSVTIEDDVYIKAGDYAVSGNGSYDNTTIIINGGTFKCTGSGAVVYHPQNGTLTINGGTFDGIVAGIQICDGNTTITDATVTVTGTDEGMVSKTGDGNIPDAAAVSIINRSGYSDTYPTLNIKGGIFKSTNGKAVKAYAWSDNSESTWDATGYVTIEGGSFSSIVDDTFLASGYSCDTEATDGLYSVSASV